MFFLVDILTVVGDVDYTHMKLTDKQQEWVSLVVSKGMPAVQESIDWAANTMWALENDSVSNVAGLLELDLKNDYVLNGAVSYAQAFKFIGILKKIGSIQ